MWLLPCATICAHPRDSLSPWRAEMSKAGLIDEMVQDTLDSAFETETLEEDTEA